MDSISLLPDPVTWRNDLFAEDLIRPICDCSLKITRAGESMVAKAPLLELAHALTLCFERCVLTGEDASEYLWDTGRQVKVGPAHDADIIVHFPVGTQPITMTKQSYTDVVLACYTRALMELANAPLLSTVDQAALNGS